MSPPILRDLSLGFPWETLDPFLFCVHHVDDYPAGNAEMGPAASLAGRALGQDFDPANAWRMYHGLSVPGFPQHPHRGFETVTIVRRGFIDHSDSLGATARFGPGDVQWLTAGKGIVHCEMFPLLDERAPNPLELFQIWLNLPAADKLVAPHFSMLWKETIPVCLSRDEAGRATEVTVVAGSLAGKAGQSPPPSSWASRTESDVAIWLVRMEPGARWTMPPAGPATRRALYLHSQGASASVGGRQLVAPSGVELQGDVAVDLQNGPVAADLLLLQGRPIGERVVQYGPFVMSSPGEIQQAFIDYQRTGFGGWPWQSDGPVHARDAGRFARQVDGRLEKP